MHAPEALAIRPAAADEAEAIRRLVRAQPRMNPTGLDWRNFVVVVRPDGRLAGCVQLRPAGAGAVELGSLVVAPAERGKGLAGRLIAAVLASVLVQGTTISPAARRLGVPMTRIVPAGRDDRDH